MTDGAPDPDAELVAYLDGELPPAAARRVEARLAADPAYRDRAAALRRSFALLDVLPKPETSPTFATRTLARLPAAKSGGSASVPVPIPAARPVWPWAAGVAAAAAVAFVAGYLGTAAIPPTSPVTEPAAENLSVADLRLAESLPLYAVADDLAFVDRLADPELFGEEAVPTGPPVEPEKPSGKAADALIQAFRDLPPADRDRVRQLERQVAEQPPARRDRLARALEAYAAWLDRLPAPDRSAVLAAPSSEARLDVIRSTRHARWVAGLPPARRKELEALPAVERAKLVARWQAEEVRRRERWEDAHLQWAAARAGRQPWPFDDERMRAEVAAFARAAYRPDDPDRPTRLTPPEQDRLREVLEAAEKGGEWGPLGRAVHLLSRKYETLPEPADGKPVLRFADLWPRGRAYFEARTKPREKVEAAVGKWPEFALAVRAEADRSKQLDVPASFALGPSRPAEFREEVRRFLPELRKKASAAEWKGLDDLGGKWPEYPRELVRLAKAHDLSVPGAMPPGLPSRWDQTYTPNVRPAPKAGG